MKIHAASEQLNHLAGEVGATLQHSGEQVSSVVAQGVDRVTDAAHQLEKRALRVTDTAMGYIRHEPVKAVLIAAATGAALVALIGIMTRSQTRH